MAEDSKPSVHAREARGKPTLPELIEPLESEDVRTRLLAEVRLGGAVQAALGRPERRLAAPSLRPGTTHGAEPGSTAVPQLFVSGR